jgi:hypothetical protein
MAEAEWDKTLAINLKGTYLTAHYRQARCGAPRLTQVIEAGEARRPAAPPLEDRLVAEKRLASCLGSRSH